MRITVDNRIRIPVDELDEATLEELQGEFTYENPQYRKLKAMGKRYMPKAVKQYLSSWQMGGGEFSVPRGGMHKVQNILGSRLRVRRRMTRGDPSLAGQIPDHLMTLRPYQVELKDACVTRRDTLIISPQGSGKTTTAYAIAAELKLPTLVVVPSEKIFNQWVKGVTRQLGMDPSEVGIIRGNKRVIRPLTIGMQQTLRNCASEYADTFGVIIGDEAQRFAADTFFKVIDVMRAEFRIGMTADERRADGKEFLVHDVFGERAMEVARETLIEQGAIIDAVVRIIPTEFRASWYSKLKPRARMASGVQDKLAEQIMNDEGRNTIIMQVLGWCVEDGEPTITLAARRDHCAMLNAMSLEAGWNSGLLLGGKDSAEEFERTEREMRDRELMQAVGTYQAVGVGFDLPLVSRGIFASPCAGSSARQQFGQYCGRYERPEPETGKVGANDAIVYYIWDQHVHGINHVRNIARWKPKTEVFHKGQWVDAKRFVREEARRAKSEEEDQDAQLGFIQVDRC